MAGDPNNVKIWAEADVYIIIPSDLIGDIADVMPASISDPLPSLCRPAGLLNGDAGFEESVEWDKTEHPAWGYGTIKIGFKNFKMTRKFTTLEENPTVAYLRSKNDTGNRVKVSKPAEVYVLFEKRTDDGQKHRLLSCMPSSVEYGGRTENESDLPEIEFETTIIPNSDKELFITQSSESTGTATYTFTATVAGTPTGGTFKFAVEGSESTPNAHNAASASVKTAIETIAGVTAVSVSGSAGGPYTITYTGPGPLLLGDNSLTGGSSPTVNIV